MSNASRAYWLVAIFKEIVHVLILLAAYTVGV